MKSFLAEVFIDDRPILTKTVVTSQPWTATSVALKAAVKLKVVKHRAKKYVVRLTKLS